jgi:hypothetical protein
MARLLLLLVLATPVLAKDCIPFDQAPDHIGKTACVIGKVLKVGQSYSGSFFLDFCEDYKKCPFTVVVFRSSLKKVGDVRALEGKEIEITGKIKEWKGRAEIVLKDAGQLEGESGKLPPVPATYDADRHGNFSAGKFSAARSSHPTHKRTTKPSDAEIDEE